MRSILKVSKPFAKAALVSAFAFSLAVLAPMLHADTILTYDLIPDSGSSFGGTVTITLADPVATTGQVDYTTSTGLDSLVFNIDNQQFTLANAVGNTLVRFLNGQLNDITFSEQIGSPADPFSLHTTATYDFAFDGEQDHSTGTFSATPDPGTSPVPEPGSLALLGTGLLGGAGSLYRRVRR
jgi:PEP-CTERM motif